jgi:hypothetical protein
LSKGFPDQGSTDVERRPRFRPSGDSGRWAVGRIYETRGMPQRCGGPAVRHTHQWAAPTLDAAKADFEANWRKWL